jgi:ASC-1-like (ASCH) protein
MEQKWSLIKEGRKARDVPLDGKIAQRMDIGDQIKSENLKLGSMGHNTS